jgi:heme/copper-type cytochrome/quinol oxidase subunit 2
MLRYSLEILTIVAFLVAEASCWAATTTHGPPPADSPGDLLWTLVGMAAMLVFVWLLCRSIVIARKQDRSYGNSNDHGGDVG